MNYQSLIVSATAALKQPFRIDKELLTVARVHESERSSTDIAVFRPGGSAGPHRHLHDEIIIFLSGRAVFQIGDQIRNVSANDIISVPAGVIHGTLRAETDCVVVSISAKANPIRPLPESAETKDPLDTQ
ncbi:MAG: cupin domain-containing protein [Polaromonas sp.]|uniref:cupin domain-containing protein n=1 Tax=Polaromonas sp. TaxID=1869339 RepID=UPI0027325BB9|nr:cupin domain-containing protein [Polaromonas sp.]MDP3798496.1 cupin domain-containing protein [Polaromonas sp.]